MRSDRMAVDAAHSNERDHHAASKYRGAGRGEYRKRGAEVQRPSVLTVTLFANSARNQWQAWIGDIVGRGTSREDALLDLREQMFDAVDFAVLFNTPTDPQPIESRQPH